MYLKGEPPLVGGSLSPSSPLRKTVSFKEETKQDDHIATLKKAKGIEASNVLKISLEGAIKDFLKKYPKTHILFGVPCYGGNVNMNFTMGLISLTTGLTNVGIPYTLYTTTSESLVQRARNTISSFFLKSEASHLMFIDSDISFEWLSVIKLLLGDKDVCGGCYPKKSLNFSKLVKQSKELSSLDEHKISSEEVETRYKDFLSKIVDYVFNPIYKVDENNNIVIPIKMNMIEVKDVGTGFMMIRRNVFEKLIEHFPEMEYINNISNDCIGSDEKFYSFFDCEIDPETKVYLSEDYYFCKKWKSIGGEIWLDITIDLIHHGSFAFYGAISKNIDELDSLNEDKIYLQKKK